MNIFVWKWSKIAAQKKVFFCAEFALVHPPMASVLLSASVKRCFVSRMRDFCIAYLELQVVTFIPRHKSQELYSKLLCKKKLDACLEILQLFWAALLGLHVHKWKEGGVLVAIFAEKLLFWW